MTMTTSRTRSGNTNRYPQPSQSQKRDRACVVTTKSNNPNVDDCILQEALSSGIRNFGFPGIALSISVGAGAGVGASNNSVSTGVSTSTANKDTTSVVNSSKIEFEYCWSGSVGYSNIETAKRMDAARDCFCVGSITKTFIAIVVLQLVEEKILDLDRTVMSYFEQGEGKDQDSVSAVACAIRKVANASVATIRQLLCHQSGIPTWEFEPDWIRSARGCNIRPGKLWSPTEPLHYLVNTPPTGKPGHNYSYSNTNYTLLGLLIERVIPSDNTVSTEIQHRIWDRLGLRSAYLESFPPIKQPSSLSSPPPSSSSFALSGHYHFATTAFKESAGLSSQGFHKPVKASPSTFTSNQNNNNNNHPLLDLVNTSEANLSCEWTAGGICMTVIDLMKYGCALLRSEHHLLTTPEMRKELFTYRPPKSDTIGITSSGLKESQTLNDSTGRYSQGICKTITRIKTIRKNKANINSDELLEEDDDELEVDCVQYGHGGLTLGFSSRLAYLVDHDIVVACATNAGVMHCGYEEECGKSPWDAFWDQVLLPAVVAFVNDSEDLVPKM